jgi:hypothetical protein
MVAVHRSGHAVLADPATAVNPRRARMLPYEQQPPMPKVIEFPKPAAPDPEPMLPLIEELAEPMLDSPRILDVPEQPEMFEGVEALPIVRRRQRVLMRSRSTPCCWERPWCASDWCR